MSDLTLLDQDAECTNLNEAIKRHNYIPLSECIDLCESEAQCQMTQYYDKLLSDSDSRCYIFNQICHLSQDVGDRADTSHIYYKNQFTDKYCTDYPSFTDAYTDNCDAYVTYGFCANGTTTDKATSAHFEEAKNPIYGTASDACCACGGGKRVFGITAVAYINELDDDTHPECDFDLDSTTDTQYLAKWNNFALYELGENIVDRNHFVYSELLDVNLSHEHTFIACDFSLFLLNTTETDADFFIFASIARTEESLYFMNSKYFQLDLDVLSSNSELHHRSFEYCSEAIVNASDSDIVDVIIPCFTHYQRSTTQEPFSTDILLSTESNISVAEGSEGTFLQKYLKYVKYVYPVHGDNWYYTAIAGAVLFVFFLLCCICLRKCCCRKRRKKAKQNSEVQVLVEEDVEHAHDEHIPHTLEGEKLLSISVQTPPLSSHGSKETDPDTTVSIKEIHPRHDELYDSSTDESNVVVMDIEQAIKMGKETYFETDAQAVRVHKKKKSSPYGILYEQTGFYDEKQMQNITQYFRDNPKKAPYLLFGDNIEDKKRADGTKRQKSGNQSKVLGQYDRSIGFGIPTTFDNARAVGYDDSPHNYKQLLQYEFAKLKAHLQNGSDVVIPYPSQRDLSDKRLRVKFYRKDKQIIHHNIGTGISNLQFGDLCLIQAHIAELAKYSADVKRVHQVLYNDEDDDDIDDAYEDYVNHSKCGLLVFQFGWYSHDQMRQIHQKYNSKSKLKKAPRMCFGDNDIDAYRDKNTPRTYKAGQASAMAQYDRLFAYGIITTFYKKRTPIIGQFMHLMDKQFEPLKHHLLSGCDVVLPAPTKQDVKTHRSKYMMGGKQIIFHNIGTGIADLPFDYIQYIQTKITELQKYARGVKTLQYYAYSAQSKAIADKQMKHKEPQIQESYLHLDVKEKIKVIYQCPHCTKRVHYLMKFHNCSHSLCAACLSDYIFRHLDYVDNNEQHRFQCWATYNGKCKARICLQDVYYPKDRCKCDECLALITPTGNDTILDDESFKQFKSIMVAFSIRSRWDTDECPDCGRPFPIPREWREKLQNNDANQYNYNQKQSFFDDVVINPSECNCCGKSIENEFEYEPNAIANIQGIDEKEEEIYSANKDNKCRVCRHFYCDECRTNCFYEIEEYSTVKPPTPVAEARYDFCAEIKLKQQDFVEYEQKHDRHQSHHERKKSSKHKMRYPFVEKFELCEICWYRFYCRECPHCKHRFCGICDTKWRGSTANWLDKYKDQQITLEEEEQKYDNQNIYKLIDEKPAHDKRSHHSCETEKRKIEREKKKAERSRKTERRQKEKALQRKIAETEKQNKHVQRQLSQKLKDHSKYKEHVKQKETELIHKRKETEHQLLQSQREIERLKNDILRLQNGELVKEKDKLAERADQTEQKRLKVVAEKEAVQIEKERFRMIADDEKQKKEEALTQFEEFKKKMYVIVWQWKENNGEWVTYGDEVSQQIEKLAVNQEYIFKANKNGQSYKVMRTHADKGTQVNINTKVTRLIKRKRITSNIEYPQWWNMEGLNMSNEGDNGYIGGSGGAYSKPQLIPMSLVGARAHQVAQEFYATSKHSAQYGQYYKNINIIKVESMQNQRLYDEFWSKRTIMSRINKLNERLLWHGTRTENVMSEIEYSGFRKEFNKTAMWGEGTYFAVNSGYSVGYSSNQNGVYKMFQCKVLCGESITGNRNYKLQTWPKKNNGKGLIYDSLVSTQGDIYVIHDDVRAYPMFVVTFKMS